MKELRKNILGHSYSWKQIHVNPDAGGVDERKSSYSSTILLFRDGVVIGDYAVNLVSRDCNVMFYSYGLLNAPYRIYSMSNAKVARGYLMEYAQYGKIPEGPPDPPNSGGPTTGVLNESGYKYDGVLDA